MSAPATEAGGAAAPTPHATREQVAHALEEELERIDSPEVAEAIVEQAEQLAASETEASAAAAAATRPARVIAAIERSATTPREQAEVLAATAAQAVAPTPEAPAVVAAAQEVAGTRPAVVPAAAQRGRTLLREAIIRRMGPLDALDARLFLAINCLPHPPALDRLANAITIATTGGTLWFLGVYAAARNGSPRGAAALRVVIPTVVAATSVNEYFVKPYFRRRRPFIDVIRAIVVGKKPGSWSFPSGHTCSSFACAWVLSTFWPRRAPLFFGAASCVGLSRVYVGAHYPGDVLSGMLIGTALAECFRRVTGSALSLLAPRRPT